MAWRHCATVRRADWSEFDFRRRVNLTDVQTLCTIRYSRGPPEFGQSHCYPQGADGGFRAKFLVSVHLIHTIRVLHVATSPRLASPFGYCVLSFDLLNIVTIVRNRKLLCRVFSISTLQNVPSDPSVVVCVYYCEKYITYSLSTFFNLVFLTSSMASRK